MPQRMTPTVGFAMKVERFYAVTNVRACSMSSVRAWGQSPKEREIGTVPFARQVFVKFAFIFSSIFPLFIRPCELDSLAVFFGREDISN